MYCQAKNHIHYILNSNAPTCTALLDYCSKPQRTFVRCVLKIIFPSHIIFRSWSSNFLLFTYKTHLWNVGTRVVFRLIICMWKVSLWQAESQTAAMSSCTGKSSSCLVNNDTTPGTVWQHPWWCYWDTGTFSESQLKALHSSKTHLNAIFKMEILWAPSVIY